MRDTRCSKCGAPPICLRYRGTEKSKRYVCRSCGHKGWFISSDVYLLGELPIYVVYQVQGPLAATLIPDSIYQRERGLSVTHILDVLKSCAWGDTIIRRMYIPHSIPEQGLDMSPYLIHPNSTPWDVVPYVPEKTYYDGLSGLTEEEFDDMQNEFLEDEPTTYSYTYEEFVKEADFERAVLLDSQVEMLRSEDYTLVPRVFGDVVFEMWCRR